MARDRRTSGSGSVPEMDYYAYKKRREEILRRRAETGGRTYEMPIAAVREDSPSKPEKQAVSQEEITKSEENSTKSGIFSAVGRLGSALHRNTQTTDQEEALQPEEPAKIRSYLKPVTLPEDASKETEEAAQEAADLAAVTAADKPADINADTYPEDADAADADHPSEPSTQEPDDDGSADNTGDDAEEYSGEEYETESTSESPFGAFARYTGILMG